MQFGAVVLASVNGIGTSYPGVLAWGVVTWVQQDSCRAGYSINDSGRPSI